MLKHVFFLAALCALLAVQGCTLSRQRIRRADAVVAATVPDVRNRCVGETHHCAKPSPLLAAADQAMAASTPGHPQQVVTLLDNAEAALAARVNLIRAARRSIDVQTYIWSQDDVGQLMIDQLVQAAQRGVKVRILADQLFSFGDVPLLNRLARVSRNLQVRLYNPTFHEAQTGPLAFAAGVVCCFARFNQRMHNKLVLVDAEIGITGGRNIQDRYFDWDPDFDYVDRDVMVGGAAARDMATSFQRFWLHRRAVPLTGLRDVNAYILDHPAAPGWPAPVYKRPRRVAQLQQDAEDPAWLARHLTDHSLPISQVEFFSDLPAKTDAPHRRHALDFTRHLMDLVRDAHHDVLLQTPYLVMSDRAKDLFAQMRQRPAPPRVVVSTNSLASTDAFAVYALSYKHRKRYLKDYGFHIFEMKPHAAAARRDYADANRDDPPVPTQPSEHAVGAAPLAPAQQAWPAPRLRRRQLARQQQRNKGTEVRGFFGSRGSSSRPAPLNTAGRRYGLHAKSIVVDDRFAMVGSHNFDPRSDHYNTEAGVIVHDRRFANQVRASILQLADPDNAWMIAPRQPLIPVLTNVNQAIGDISAQLPLFDFWPYRYATDYQLKPGCQPMLPSDPRFSSCYTAVGDFPEVALSFKLIYTRLITAFGSVGQGIL